MSKSYFEARAVPQIDRDELEHLPTKALLARLDKLRRCEDSLEGTDMNADEITAVEGILFKESPEWREAYEAVKAVLSTREHVPGAAERRQMRHERAKRNRSGQRICRRG